MTGRKRVVLTDDFRDRNGIDLGHAGVAELPASLDAASLFTWFSFDLSKTLPTPKLWLWSP